MRGLYSHSAQLPAPQLQEFAAVCIFRFDGFLDVIDGGFSHVSQSSVASPTTEYIVCIFPPCGREIFHCLRGGIILFSRCQLPQVSVLNFRDSSSGEGMKTPRRCTSYTSPPSVRCGCIPCRTPCRRTLGNPTVRARFATPRPRCSLVIVVVLLPNPNSFNCASVNSIDGR